MARKVGRGLRRDLAGTALAGTMFGNVAAGVFIVLGVTAARALGVTPMVFIVAGVVFLLTVFSYIEGMAALPQAGGASGFARRAFNELVSFFAGWALILDYLIIIALAAFFASHYIASLPGLGVLAHHPWDITTSVVLVVAAALVNVRGVTASASLGVVVSFVALVVQGLLGIVGLALVFEPGLLAASVQLGAAPTWSAVAFALPIAMVGFTGLEAAANLSGELREPGYVLARPMMYAAVVAVVLLVAISLLGLSAVPVTGDEPRTLLGVPDEGGGFLDRPIIGIVEHLPIAEGLATALEAAVALLAAAVLFLVTSTSISGVSRLTYSMSVHRQVPSILARLARGAGAPAVAVVMFALGSVGLLLLASTIGSSALVLAQLYAFGAMFSFMVANAAVVWLRWTEPDLPRPFLAPLNVRVRGRRFSLTSLLALVATAGMWVLVLATHEAALALGSFWMVIGLVGYGTYRLTHGHTLTDRYEPRLAPEIHVQARPYRRILLAVRPEPGRLYGAGDAEVASLVHKLLDEPERGEVAVMFVHELPLTKALTAPLGEDEQATTRRLTLLRSVVDRLGLRMTTTVARARGAGRAICQEAARRECDAVVLATRHKRRPGDPVFGKTVSYVLRHAPCDVLILRLPLESLQPSRRGDRERERVRS